MAEEPYDDFPVARHVLFPESWERPHKEMGLFQKCGNKESGWNTRCRLGLIRLRKDEIVQE